MAAAIVHPVTRAGGHVEFCVCFFSCFFFFFLRIEHNRRNVLPASYFIIFLVPSEPSITGPSAFQSCKLERRLFFTVARESVRRARRRASAECRAYARTPMNRDAILDESISAAKSSNSTLKCIRIGYECFECTYVY